MSLFEGGIGLKSYAMEKLRNFILVGHGGCGKTMLAEAMLYTAKADRFGKVDEQLGTDHDPEEVKGKFQSIPPSPL